MLQTRLEQLLAGAQHRVLELRAGLPRTMQGPPRRSSTCPTNAVAVRMSIAVTFWAMNHPGSSTRSGVSDVPRHQTVRDVPKQHSSLSGGLRAEIAGGRAAEAFDLISC